MKILIKQARIVDPSSTLNGQITDLFIENGVIAKMGNAGSFKVKPDEIIEIDGLHVSPGWMDIFSDFADPGFEFKETLESGARAAAAGGFTDVMIIPNTQPAIQNKSTVEYIVQRSRSLPVDVHPIGAVTRNAEGKDLAEMYDMRASGAIAFSDGIHPIQSAGLLVKALQYVKAFDGIIIQVPDDRTIHPQGLMNEGIVSTRLGLPGKPAMSEELIVARDIKLARYADSSIHFTAIASAKSVEYIRRGKAGNKGISCSVTPYHLLLSDEDLGSYDTNLKVNPPLRTPADREALRVAIREGVIDCIASHHFPHEYDSKVLEFEYARYGMISLETAYAVLSTAMPDIAQEKWISLLSCNPRKLFGLPAITIEEGMIAKLTLFNPSARWKFSEKDIRSKSKNSPFIGRELTGKVHGIINGGNAFIN